MRSTVHDAGPQAGAGLAALVGAAVARADVIGDWNATGVKAEAVLIRPRRPRRGAGMAMVQGAVYDAVNAIDRRHEPYLLDPTPSRAQPCVSQDAAVATAAHHVLVAIAPRASTPRSTGVPDDAGGDPRRPDRAGRRRGRRGGRQAMLASREDDGFLAAFTPAIGTDAGDWRPIGRPATPASTPTPGSAT